jgi:hypothetical protein
LQGRDGITGSAITSRWWRWATYTSTGVPILRFHAQSIGGPRDNAQHWSRPMILPVEFVILFVDILFTDRIAASKKGLPSTPN